MGRYPCKRGAEKSAFTGYRLIGYNASMVIDDYSREVERILLFLRNNCGLQHDNSLEQAIKAAHDLRCAINQLGLSIESRIAHPYCTTMQAAEYLGVETAVSARKILKSAGIRPLKASGGGKGNKTEYDLSEITLKLPACRVFV